ncbi:MAG: biopolymer transporter ExbD [Leptospiraceae bacterium]|nr:biopolymer transporter ExbD [Leptospiraceae bacterium]MDW8306336.1 biopolymer transporter ExbD [Leptospiraceae bacterium]
MKVRPRLQLRAGIELAPFVDVLFLLITYFLINTTLERNPAIKIQLPKSSTAQVETQQNIVIYVQKNDRIFLNEKPVSLTDLPAELTRIVKDKDKDHIVIKGDREVSYQSIITIMDYVNQAGITHFNLATVR